MSEIPYKLGELLSIVEKLDPDRLLFVRRGDELEADLREALLVPLARTHDPRQRLANIEFLLLIMHRAREVDSARYLRKVFLPWIGIQQRTRQHRERIGCEFERLPPANTDDDAIHIATKIYRPLVADIFDPYLTLLIATYAFIKGEFQDIQTSNLSAGERNKVEYIEARIREDGGPSRLLRGYDPIVRNALSHLGSESLLAEPGFLIFRDIKRGSPPSVQARRWTHDELHWRVLDLLEFLTSVDVAVEIFGLDCIELIASDFETNRVFMSEALSHEQIQEHRRRNRQIFDRIRSQEKPLAERVADLALFVFLACAERNIPCAGLSYNELAKVLFINIPAGGPITDGELVNRVTTLVRYPIIAREVMGDLFDTFVGVEQDGKQRKLSVALAGSVLDEYADAKAGLVDLVADAEIGVDGSPVEILFDEVALSAAEDSRLGQRLPRRGRT